MNGTCKGRPVSSTVRDAHGSQHPRGALRELLRHLESRGVASSARAVAVALWTHADAFGRCWPSQGTLARLAGVCERTVRTGLHALERAGVLLRDVPRLAERRRVKRTTAYRFTFGSWRSTGAPVARPASPAATGHHVELRDESADGSEVSEAPVDGHQLGAGTEAPAAGEALDVTEGQQVSADTREAIAPPSVEVSPATEAPQVDAPPPPAPPATAAAPSPATAAARRPQGMNVPRLARPAAHPVARTAPPPTRAPSPRGPTVAALADVLARCSALTAPSRRPAASGTPAPGSARPNDRPPTARAVEGPPRAAAG